MTRKLIPLALLALAVEAQAKRPEFESRWANLATARHHHLVRLEGWAREYADRLAALAPKEARDAK